MVNRLYLAHPISGIRWPTDRESMEMIFYQDRFVPEGAAGCARGFLIFIRPKYKDDKGLLEHEKLHVHQFWTGGLIIHSMRYKFSKKYRFASEVAAYAEQAKWYADDRRPKFARFIAESYGLDVTEYEALEALRVV